MHPRRPPHAGSIARSAVLAGALCALLAAPTAGQQRPPGDEAPALVVGAAPLAVWDESRRGGIGGRASLVIADRLHLMGEGILFFRDLDVAEPGASASHRSTQVSANALFDLNAEGPVRIYLGLGVAHARLSIDLTVGDRTSGVVFDDTVMNRIIGVRLPLDFGAPFVEWNEQLGEERPWTLTAGVSFRVAG